MIWLELLICILIILFLGRKVAAYGDIIAAKTGLGGLWIGLVLISITTSLPELFTGVSAITIVSAPDITIGNLLGANTFNLLNLALLDIFSRSTSLMNLSSTGQRFTAWFSLILVTLVSVAIFLQPAMPFSAGWIGWTTPVIIILYLFFVRQMFYYGKRRPQVKTAEIKYDRISLRRTYVYFTVAAVFIIGAGVWLAIIGDQIAESTGLGQSFVGSLLIGFTTTLPEITVSFAALRLGAVDLAISNMLGSNMFNMFLVCIDDLIFTGGPILGAVSPNNLLTGITVITMTAITIAGLYFKPKRFNRLSWYNVLIMVIFIVGAYIGYRINT